MSILTDPILQAILKKEIRQYLLANIDANGEFQFPEPSLLPIEDDPILVVPTLDSDELDEPDEPNSRMKLRDRNPQKKTEAELGKECARHDIGRFFQV